MLAAQEQEQAMAAARATAQYQPQPAPVQQVYPLQTTSYGAYDLRREERSPMMGRLLIAGVFVVAVACAFCCGIFFGFELAGFFPAAPAGPIRATPTREGLFLLHQVIVHLA